VQRARTKASAVRSEVPVQRSFRAPLPQVSVWVICVAVEMIMRFRTKRQLAGGRLRGRLWLQQKTNVGNKLVLPLKNALERMLFVARNGIRMFGTLCTCPLQNLVWCACSLTCLTFCVTLGVHFYICDSPKPKPKEHAPVISSRGDGPDVSVSCSVRRAILYFPVLRKWYCNRIWQGGSVLCLWTVFASRIGPKGQRILPPSSTILCQEPQRNLTSECLLVVM